VSGKYQLKIPHKLFIIPCHKYLFLSDCIIEMQMSCCFPEEGCAFTAHLRYPSNRKTKMNDSEKPLIYVRGGVGD